MTKCREVAKILGNANKAEELDFMVMREFFKTDVLQDRSASEWDHVLQSLRRIFFVPNTRGMFDGDNNALGDFFCLLDLALFSCVADDDLEEHRRLTIKFITDISPTTCAPHASSQDHREVCNYCHFKTNTPALIRACSNGDFETVVALYRAGFCITTQLSTESYEVSIKSTVTFASSLLINSLTAN